MITLNFRTVEQLVLPDKKIRGLLPDLSKYFDTWRIGQISPALRPTAKRAALDLLSSLTDGHVEILADYFGEGVVIERIEHNIVRTFKSDAKMLADSLVSVEGFAGFAVSLNNGQADLLLWR
jgi:hypothetical protein